jgi:hypothetical protein
MSIGLRLQAIAILCALSLVGACSRSTNLTRHIEMERIEREVRLPAGARPLPAYDRFYAETDRGRILGVYLLAGRGHGGESHWLDDRKDLPFIEGGGCKEINLTVDRTNSIVTAISCNPTA